MLRRFVGVRANIVRRLGEVAGIAVRGACWRVFHGFGQRDRILQGFQRGAVGHVVHGEFCRIFGFFLSLFEVLLMRGERLRVQRAGCRWRLASFSRLLATAMMATAASAMATTAITATDGDGFCAVSHCFFCAVGCIGGSSLLCGFRIKQNVASIQKHF